jgi:hypothetical protein
MIYAKFDWNWLAGFGEEDFKKKFSVFLLFCDYLPLEMGDSPSFEQFRIPSPQVWFVLSLVKIDPVVLEKKPKM